MYIRLLHGADYCCYRTWFNISVNLLIYIFNIEYSLRCLNKTEGLEDWLAIENETEAIWVCI